MNEGLKGNLENYFKSSTESETEDQNFENDSFIARDIISKSSEWVQAKREARDIIWQEDYRKNYRQEQMTKFGELLKEEIVDENGINNLGEQSNIDQVRQFVKLLKNQQEFESKTKSGFEFISQMSDEELAQIIDNFNGTYLSDRGFGVAFTKVLTGQVLEEEPREQRNNSYLVGLNVLEIGGPSLVDGGYDLGNNLLVRGVNYTSIDLDKGRIPELMEEKDELLQDIFNKNSDSSFTFESYQLNVLDLNKYFPKAKWDCVCGVRFFGYPTVRKGREYELNLLQELTSHIREGGTMWFANIEPSSLQKADFEKLGLQFVEKHHDQLPYIWFIRKKTFEENQKVEEIEAIDKSNIVDEDNSSELQVDGPEIEKKDLKELIDNQIGKTISEISYNFDSFIKEDKDALKSYFEQKGIEWSPTDLYEDHYDMPKSRFLEKAKLFPGLFSEETLEKAAGTRGPLLSGYLIFWRGTTTNEDGSIPIYNSLFGPMNIEPNDFKESIDLMQNFPEQINGQINKITDLLDRKIKNVEDIVDNYQDGNKPTREDLFHGMSITEPYLQVIAGGTPGEGLTSEIVALSEPTKIKIDIKEKLSEINDNFLPKLSLLISDPEILAQGRKITETYYKFISDILEANPQIMELKKLFAESRDRQHLTDYINLYIEKEWERKDEAIEIALQIKNGLILNREFWETQIKNINYNHKKA